MFAYVGLSQNLKDLKICKILLVALDSRDRNWVAVPLSLSLSLSLSCREVVAHINDCLFQLERTRHTLDSQGQILALA